jgi:hypothetical protein
VQLLVALLVRNRNCCLLKCHKNSSQPSAISL